MANYVAKYACQYGGRVFKPDEILNYNKEVVVCPDCNGKQGETVCKLCKDSGCINPPHHFIKLGEEHAKKEKEGEEVLIGEEKKNLAIETKKEEIAAIRKEIERLGGSYNGTWGLERLKMHLIKYRKENGERNVMPLIPGV